MKFLIIPDVHGTSHWKHVVNTLIFDKIIFLGDYMDSFSVTSKGCQNNLKDIISFKLKNLDKVILLSGNHDNQYIFLHTSVEHVRCSGFKSTNSWTTNKVFLNNLDLFQAAWEYNNYLFSHAGLLNTHFIDDIEPIWDKSIKLSEFLTQLWRIGNSRVFKIKEGAPRYGFEKYSSIFWTDYTELIKDPLQNWNQVVGHSIINDIKKLEHKENNAILYFTDCVEHYKQNYLVLDL